MMKCAGIYEDMASIHDLITTIYEKAWTAGVNAELNGESFFKVFTKEVRDMQFVLEGAMQNKAIRDIRDHNKQVVGEECYYE